MFCLLSLTVGVGRAATHSRLFSTTWALRSGSFFNLGGLGASREAQYLSKEHGIPRTEFFVCTHLIRSGEVGPFAPVPGATPSMAAARVPPAARAQDVESVEATTRDNLVIQLQAATEELAHTKRALIRLQARSKGLQTAVYFVPILVLVMVFVGYQVYREKEEELAEPWQRLSTPLGVQVQQSVPEIHDSAKHCQEAIAEEHALAKSGLTSFEAHPRTSTGTGSSLLSGLFWAKTNRE